MLDSICSGLPAPLTEKTKEIHLYLATTCMDGADPARAEATKCLTSLDMAKDTVTLYIMSLLRTDKLI